MHHLEIWNNCGFTKTKLKILKLDSFDGLQNLPILGLTSNEISDLPAGVFAELQKLKLLFLNSNKLTTIHSDSFGAYNQLTYVKIQDNKINAIDEKFIDNAAISGLNMTNNICSQLVTGTKSEIKANLKKCFNNYQPRSRHQVESCGKSKTGRGNIIGGTRINSGDFPW